MEPRGEEGTHPSAGRQDLRLCRCRTSSQPGVGTDAATGGGGEGRGGTSARSIGGRCRRVSALSLLPLKVQGA